MVEPGVAEVLEFADGETIFEEGSIGEYLFVVLEGGVCIRKRAELFQTVLAELGPGEIFGEQALIEAKPRTAYAVAEGPTRLAAYDRDAFIASMRDDPGVALRVIAGLSARLRDTTDKLQLIATQHILDRAEMVLVQKAVLESEL